VVTTYAATAQAPSTPASQPPRRCRLVLPQPPRAPDSLAWRLQFALAAYAAAAEGKRIEPKRETGARGTLKWVMEQYQRSGKWAEFKPATRKRRENIFRHVIAKAVDKPYAAISRKMMVESRDVARATPAQANVMLKVMRALFDWATEAEHMETNPAKGVPFLKVKGDGFHAWTDEETDRFEATYPLASRERVAYAVLLYTGQRRGDVVRMGRQHVKDCVLTTRQEKTEMGDLCAERHGLRALFLIPWLGFGIGASMARRRIGQETLAFVSSDAGRRCSLDDLHDLIDWAPIDRRLASISCSAKGEPA
jgi:integrase